MFVSLISLLSCTAGIDWLGSLSLLLSGGLGGNLDFGLFGLLSLLGEDRFLLAFLHFLGGLVSILVTLITGFGLSAFDFFEGHANNCFLDTGGLACALLDDVIDLYLLVETAPYESPC